MYQAAVSRLWRPAAQRRVRAAFSTLASARADWAKASSQGLTEATALVNAQVAEGFVDHMDVGVLAALKGLTGIAKAKLEQQQGRHLKCIVDAYEELVTIVQRMEDAASSMRTYLTAPNGSPIVRVATVEESKQAALAGDDGLGGGVSVYACLSLKTLESLAKEMVQFYKEELHIKFLLASEFRALVKGEPESNAAELDLDGGHQSNGDSVERKRIPQDTLQVYLTAWLGEALLDKTRLEEIVTIVNEEMQAA